MKCRRDSLLTVFTKLGVLDLPKKEEACLTRNILVRAEMSQPPGNGNAFIYKAHRIHCIRQTLVQETSDV